MKLFKLSFFRKNNRDPKSPFTIPDSLSSDYELVENAGSRYFENISPCQPETDDFLKSLIAPKHLRFLFIVFFSFILIFAGRSAHLQVINQSKFEAAASKNRIRDLRVKPERGIITDRGGVVLAENSPQFFATLMPADLPKDPKERLNVLKIIADTLDIKEEEFIERIFSLDGYSLYESVLLADDISYEKAISLIIESENIPGLNIETGLRRVYPSTNYPNGIFSHIIGYVGYLTKEEYERTKGAYALDDIIGKTGVELYYENLLRGKEGRRRVEVDALGKIASVISEDKPQIGDSLALSIDAELQAASVDILNEQLRKLNLKQAAAVVLDPRDGEILALISLPFYDNAKFIGKISQEDFGAIINDPAKPLFNRAISGEYPLGSTIKPVIAAAALEEGIIKTTTSFLSSGGIRIGSWFFPDWLIGGHGLTDVRKAIAQSVNTFFYIISGGFNNFIGLGPDKMADYMSLFGFGQKLGVDLPGEGTGLVPTPLWKEKTIGDNWYIGDTYHFSIGQGYVRATPIQIAAAMSVFANQGILFKPRILRESRNADNHATLFEPEIIRKDFLKPSTIETVRAGLRDTVVYGSAQGLASLPFKAAGKTGTAQWSTDRKPHAWFAGFAPYDNPEVVVVVLIEEGEEGSRTATQAAKRIFEKWREIKQ